MVVIDQYDNESRRGTLAGTLRPFVIEFLRPFECLSEVLRRQVAVEKQRMRVRMAEQISARAGQPGTKRYTEPARLNAVTIANHLYPKTVEQDVADNIVAFETVNTQIVLDSIDYEFAAIRAEIAPYLPDKS